MEIINISKKNEVYIKIDSEASTAQEICDHFTFMVPGYTFMPAYRNRIWDGKIRLFNVHNRLLYGGLFEHLCKFLYILKQTYLMTKKFEGLIRFLLWLATSPLKIPLVHLSQSQ